MKSCLFHHWASDNIVFWNQPFIVVTKDILQTNFAKIIRSWEIYFFRFRHTLNLDNIERFVREAGKRTEDLDKMWVDGYTICQYLHVSERTLRRLRAQREITYSTVGRKYFYTIGSVKRSMEHKIIRSNEEMLQKMIDHYGQNLDKAIKNNK